MHFDENLSSNEFTEEEKDKELIDEHDINECDLVDASDQSTSQSRSLGKCYTVEQAVETAGFGLFQVKLGVICGVLTAADAIEMLLLSVLGPALRCYWFLSSNEIATITTVVFIGFLFGAPFWGFVSDRFGRWPTLFTILSIISYFGLLTSFSPNYGWIITIRLLVGFAIGGANTSFTLFSEFLTVKQRGKILIGYNIFWAFGSFFEVTLAYFILPHYGWRMLVFASAVPVVIFLILMKFLPESPRYLVGAGQVAEAERIISSLFKWNRVQPLEGRLIANTIPIRNRGSLQGLFEKSFLVTTLLLPYIWFTAAFSYYGVVLISAEVFRTRHTCIGNKAVDWDAASNVSNLPYPVDVSCCRGITKDDYHAMIISSIGEFASIPLMMLLIDVIGRKITLCICNLLTGILYLILFLCMPKIAMTSILFVLRALAAGLFNLAYVYTTEVYPTSIRGVAVGIFSSISRLGAMLTPYVAQVMMPEISQIGAYCLYAGMCVISAICSFFLPVETKGRELPSSYDTENEVVSTK